MTCMHERLRAVYNTYVMRYFDEKMRGENGVKGETQRLVLPGEEGTDGECDYTQMFEQPSEKVVEVKASNNQDNVEESKVDES